MIRMPFGALCASFVLTALIGCATDETGDWCDAGGVTFDFQAASDRRLGGVDLPTAATLGNLIPADEDAAPLPRGYEKWHTYRCFNHETLPNDSPERKGLAPYVKMAKEGGVFSVTKGDDLMAFCAKSRYPYLYCRAEGTWRKYVKLPDAHGGRYRFSFRYKVRNTQPQVGCHDAGLAIIHTWKLNADGSDYVHVNRPDGANLEESFMSWTPQIVDFEVPAGADIVSFQLRHDGVGDFQAKDVHLARAPEKSETSSVAIQLAPAQWLDSRFAVSANQCAQLTWEWRLNAPDGFAAADSEFRLALPRGFAFLGDTFATSHRVEARDDGSSVVVFSVKDRLYAPGKSFQSWHKPSMLIRSTGAVGTEGTMTLSCWHKGRKTGDSGAITLYTVPGIKVASPARYLCAAMPGAGQTANFRQPEACEAFARFLGDIGVRQLTCEPSGWVLAKNREVYMRAFRAAGMRALTPCSNKAANGYFIGNHDDIAPEDRFVTDLKGGPWKHSVEQSICPRVVIEERPYFREKVVPALAEQLKGCDGLRANWEPFMYRDHGCYCAKCRAVFAQKASLDETKLAADWPACVKQGAVHGAAWTRFRSQQMGELVRVLNRRVMGMTGGAKSLGFIPAITWREVNSMWRTLHPSAESEPFDYAMDIPTLGSWGPYVIWDVARPYSYCKRGPLVHFIGARDMREQTDRDYPAARRPRLLGGTQGLQCGTWITQPEWLEMAMDSYFFNGFQGTQAYFFPEGFDARYVAGYARSAARAAKYESFVWDGVRNDASVTLTPVAEYAQPCTRVTEYLPGYRNEPMLQKAVYDWKGRKVIAVFNFWENGEAFFDLRVTGLKSGDCVLVDEAGNVYETGNLAQKGVRLTVGAARTRVFAILPRAEVSAQATCVTPQMMDARYRQRRAALRAAAEEDARYEKMAGGQATLDTKAEI